MEDARPDKDPVEPRDETERVTLEAKAKLDDIESDFEERLKKLTEKADTSTNKYRSQQAKTARERKLEGESARGLGYGLTYAYVLAGPPVVGYFVGLLIDQNQTGTEWKSWLAIVGVVAGFAAMLILIQRDNNRNNP